MGYALLGGPSQVDYALLGGPSRDGLCAMPFGWSSLNDVLCPSVSSLFDF